MNPALGYIFAILSLILNGSFSSLNKLPKVVKSKIDPLIFNLYFSCGVILSSLFVFAILAVARIHVTFTYLGVLSGFLLSFASLFTFATIGKIGLSVGVAIWSGSAILTSFFEGLIAQGKPHSYLISILGVVVLIIGILGVAFSKLISQLLCGVNLEEEEQLRIQETQQLIDPNKMSKRDSNSVVSIEQQNSTDSKVFYEGQGINVSNHSMLSNVSQGSGLVRTSSVSIKTHDELLDEMDLTVWLLGIFYALLTGITGGSVALPTVWTDHTNSGAKFLPSFCIGVVLVFPITFLYNCLFNNNPISWHFKICFIPGLISGIIWNMANLCSIFAVKSLSYAVAYPIMQSSLIIATVWGVFVWKEIINKKVMFTLFTFCLLVVGGCILIAWGV